MSLLLVKDKSPDGNVSDVDTRNYTNDNYKTNFAQIFLYLTEWFQQQTLSNFDKTIVKYYFTQVLMFLFTTDY